MKTIKNYIAGQITIPLIITLGSILVGSVLWVADISASGERADAEIRERVVKLETVVVNTDKNVSEIKEDLRDIKKALKIAP